jgi:hypothetical protein
MASQVVIYFSGSAWVGKSIRWRSDAPGGRDIRSVPMIQNGDVGMLPNDGEDRENTGLTKACAMVRRW